MKWGQLNEEFRGFAWKRLTPHEIDPLVSNGHEFQGINALSELLGKSRKENIPTDYYFIADDDEGLPLVKGIVSTTSTWYDSREGRPRAAEWRLYYPSDAEQIQSSCKQEDLMLLGLRHSGALAIMLIESGTSAETAIRNIIGIGRVPPRGRGDLKWVEASDQDIGMSAAETLEQLHASFVAMSKGSAKPPLPLPRLDLSGDNTASLLAERMLIRWPENLGASTEVVEEVIAFSKLPKSNLFENPDETLHRWLELAEASYRLWEKDVFSRFLNPIRWDNTIDDLKLAESVSERWMSFRQSRVSRAGKVMEIFLAKIFSASGLRFDWAPVLAGNKRPDFLFPGKIEYANPAFPRTDLRLLGAKTSLKERWRQILAEGDRVPSKHGITRDDSITASTFSDMAEAHFTVVMPKPVISKYEKAPSNLIAVGSFIDELRDLQNVRNPLPPFMSKSSDQSL